MSNEGKNVKVHYVGTLDDGTKFDSSRDRGEALAFTCMAGQMIPGFDAAVRDMEVGQTVNIRLEPADADGERRDDLIQSIPMAQLAGSEELEVGARIVLSSPEGHPFPATVVWMRSSQNAAVGGAMACVENICHSFVALKW